MNTYDERLFKGGLRKRVHLQRFRRMADVVNKLNAENAQKNLNIFELGCFNCRSLEYLDFAPASYFGIDAGWVGGIDEAISKFPEHKLITSSNVEDIDGEWDVAIALETLEHLPRPEILKNYLEKIAKHCKILVATVPMEIGPLFALKQIYKMFIYRSASKHSFTEFFWQSMGRCQFVEQDNHKGFDYRELKLLLEAYFKVEVMSGINAQIPNFMNTQIGFIAHSKFYNKS